VGAQPAAARRDRRADGGRLRQARGGDTLRDATREERAAVEDLASQATALLRQAGHPVTEKTAGEIRDTLHAAALEEEAREELCSGRLVAPRTAVGVFGGAASAGTPPAARAKKPKQKQKQKAESRKQEERARAEEKARREEEHAAARVAVREAEKKVTDAEKALRAAQAELERARERAGG
jgi:hypothetical protein